LVIQGCQVHGDSYADAYEDDNCAYQCAQASSA